MYKTIKNAITKAVNVVSLSALLSVPCFSGEPSLTSTYVQSENPIMRYELFIPERHSSVYFVKEGEFEKLRVQHTLGKIGDLELSISAQDVNGEQMAGLASSFNKKRDSSFSKIDLRFFPGKDLWDLYAFTNFRCGLFSDILAGYDDDKRKGFVRFGLDQSLGKGWYIGPEIKRTLGHDSETVYQGLRIRKKF